LFIFFLVIDNDNWFCPALCAPLSRDIGIHLKSSQLPIAIGSLVSDLRRDLKDQRRAQEKLYLKHSSEIAPSKAGEQNGA
jgi:hypothetical protein